MLSEHISLSNSCYPHAVLGWIDKQNKKEEGKVHYHINRYVALHFDCLGEAQISIDSQPQRKKLPFVIVRRSPNILDRRTWIIKKPRNEKRRNKKVGKQNNTRKSHRVYFSRRERDFWWRRECKSKRRKKRAKRKGSRGSFKKGKKPDTVSPFFFTTAAATSFSPPFSVCVCVCWCWW